MNTRLDGGPTSWHGYVVPKDTKESYREFMLEFQDLQLAYEKGSRPKPSSSIFDPGIDPGKPLDASAAFDLSQAHSIQELKIKSFGAFVELLNHGKLPLGTKSPPEQREPGFPELFLEFGVPLSAKATVKVLEPDNRWLITEANGEKNSGTNYVVRAIRQLQNISGVNVYVIVQMLVYTPDISPGWSDPHFALNAPIDTPNATNGLIPNGAPYPQLVSTAQTGTYSLNYRNEPIPFRLDGHNTKPEQSDLALAFTSIARADTELNIQPDGKVPGFPADPLVPNAQPDDPYTPLLEAYANDKVQVRTLVGAHTQSHAFEIHGVKWLFEPSYKDSGYRNAQLMGLSEHFEMLFDLPGATSNHTEIKDLPAFADYFYSPSSDIVGLSNGLWGIMRAYGSRVAGVQLLPNNQHPPSPGNIDLFEQGYLAAKKTGGPVREFDVTAVTATALKGDKLVFNSRPLPPPNGELSTPNALLFVRTADLSAGKLKEGAPVEPLILRAAAGEWIKVTVRNDFKPQDSVFKMTNPPPDGTPFNNSRSVPFTTSTAVGLHPQLVAYDPLNANGLIVGFNPQDKLVMPGKAGEFYWYAGEVTGDEAAKQVEKATPIEFGATNLVAADQLIQPQFGMVGALIIEPEESSWIEDISSRASATVTKRDGTSFREFVVVEQNMVANSANSASSLFQLNGNSVVGAINYRSEPFIVRAKPLNAKFLPQLAPQGFSQAFSNSLFNPPADPETPVFVAPAGMPTRFRLVIPSTVTSNAIIAPPVFVVHGHNWQEEPYTHGSTRIGDNRLSESFGAIQGGPNQKFDLLFDSAGGSDQVAGDYLYDTYQTGGLLGTWGLFRVTNEEVVIKNVQLTEGSLALSGLIQTAKSSDLEKIPKQLKILASDGSHARIDLGEAEVDSDGKWFFQTSKTDLKKPVRVQVTAINRNGNLGATTVTEIPR